MRILIADDDPVSRHLLQSTLERLGHDVVAVSDGAHAIAALMHADGPRLAILDWMMPGHDGISVCRAIRQRPTPYVYVIMLTGRQRRDDMVEALDAEVDDFLTKPFETLELRARVRSGERVLNLQEGLLQAQEKLRRQATHDGLTELWNRSMMLDQLALELVRATRERRPLSIVMADLDRFKDINDTYRHGAGDVVLLEAGVRMRSVLRAYDGLARYGGDEFMLLLPACDAVAASEIAERARAAVAAAPVRTDAFALPMTISLGIACSADAGIEPTILIAAADEALYRAKARGRNCVEVWTGIGSRTTT